ncbi:MAG: preprotein translocase subunit YajC [Acidobacteria bacterium]|nr:preprotein translocase subunit YajC [Acidobacteriota bacterium]MCZ6726634.1 preprotein translocase subunit YajC [Acidobacteriota bacterium]
MSVLTLTIAQATSQPGLMNFLPLVLIFGIFYFLLIAPARKRQKAHQAMITELKKGDKVVTNGGLHGEVYALDDETLILKVADNVRLKVDRSAIASSGADKGAA